MLLKWAIRHNFTHVTDQLALFTFFSYSNNELYNTLIVIANPPSPPGMDFLGGVHPPKMICTPPPPEAFATAPKIFCTPANYIYFDLIVSYLIILTTKFVKLPILWSPISPCRPTKQILFNIFLGLCGCCHQAPAKANSSNPPDIYPPPNENMKIHLCPPPRGNMGHNRLF
jgi:hypothetical protein